MREKEKKDEICREGNPAPNLNNCARGQSFLEWRRRLQIWIQKRKLAQFENGGWKAHGHLNLGDLVKIGDLGLGFISA